MEFLEPSYVTNRAPIIISDEQKLINLKNEIYQVFDTFSSQTGYLQLYIREDEDDYGEELEIDAENIFPEAKLIFQERSYVF